MHCLRREVGELSPLSTLLCRLLSAIILIQKQISRLWLKLGTILQKIRKQTDFCSLYFKLDIQIILKCFVQAHLEPLKSKMLLNESFSIMFLYLFIRLITYSTYYLLILMIHRICEIRLILTNNLKNSLF